MQPDLTHLSGEEPRMITFRELFVSVATRALTRLNSDGSMTAGHNGPYFDPETPIRNTSHYLIVFLKAWELSSNSEFRLAAEKCLDYLVNDNPYRKSHTFQHRAKDGKDQCNGLIGPAWNIEALLYADKKIGSPLARNLARDLFLMHPYDEENCIWHRVEPNGKILPIDSTFNHQLWFAASAAPLAKEIPEVAERINKFLYKLKDNWCIAKNGRIVHPLWIPRIRFRESVKRLIKPKYRKEFILKEVGYHTFNLLAFAMLNNSPVTIPQVVRSRIDLAISYLSHPEFLRLIDKSKYSFSYNPPGWEAPVALMLLGGHPPDNCLYWVNQQLLLNYNKETKMLDIGVPDIETHTARIYETVMLPECFFDLVVINNDKK